MNSLDRDPNVEKKTEVVYLECGKCTFRCSLTSHSELDMQPVGCCLSCKHGATTGVPMLFRHLPYEPAFYELCRI